MTLLEWKTLAVRVAVVLLATLATGCTSQNSNDDLQALGAHAAEWVRAWLAAWVL